MEKRLESPEKKWLDMQLVFIGGAAIHNLKCWICKERSAVYEGSTTIVPYSSNGAES